jgi:MazG family protein
VTPQQADSDASEQSSDPSPPPPAQPAPAVMDRTLELVRFLRAHCQWDARQTPASLVPYLLEEAHEVTQAIHEEDESALAAELGDLLLNVAFQVVLAEERGAFDAEAVTSGIEAKMRRRHPHLYGDGPAKDWEAMKARERADSANEPTSLLHGLAPGLDPLSRAQRIQERVAAVGFDWPDAQGAFDKVIEELEEVREALASSPATLEEELGDLLFSVVNLTRLSGSHPLRALQRANAKFSSRFQALEALARARNLSLETATLAQLDELWTEIKTPQP